MKKALPLLVAFILGLLAVFGVQNYLAQKDKEFLYKTQPKRVVVANRKLMKGEKLSPDFLREREFPATMLPENVVTPQDVKDILRQPVNRDIFPGEPLLWSSIGTPSKHKSLSDVVRINERAITIPVDSVSGVDGYIQPNDLVDIYILTDVPTKKKQVIPTKQGDFMEVEVDDKKDASFLLLQNVSVLATGASFGQGVNAVQQNYGTITLAVTPEEAGLLKFAMEVGKLSLTLRNVQDFGEASEIEIFDKDSILDIAKLRAVQTERKKRIEVYRKGKAEIIERGSSSN